MTMTDLAETRRSLHALAEQVLAGPQHRRSGTIRLRVGPDGFGTIAEPELWLTATHLRVGGTEVPLAGATCATLAGADVGAPENLYKDLTGRPVDEPLTVDPAAAAIVFDALWRGDRALRRLAPSETPVLWPEHFDVGIAVGEVNYGVSPGDGYCAEPYAYVGPWTPHEGEFWNAPFGAARPLRDLDDGALDAFFAEGKARASRR
ncbi:MAG: hypothetical protein ACT4QG_13315 [Sporichthyaceae bacterium]